MLFKDEIVLLLKDKVPQAAELLEVPPDAKLGDVALPCFTLSKELKKAPNQIAEDLATSLQATDIIQRIAATGPYVNFFLNPAKRAEALLQNPEAIWEFETDGETILLESPGPNTNKPLHLGHVRNMILGSAVINLLKADGNKVVQVNINNDRGVHICKSMLAYQRWGEGKDPDKKSDHFVGDFYVRFQQEAKKDESLNEEIKLMLKAWEENDPEVRALWKKMNTWAFDGFKETYARYHVNIDKEYYESEIYLKGKEIVEQQKDTFTTDDKGNIVAPLEKYKLPDKVVLRADGTSVYMTQDLALTIQRMEEYHPTKHIWVVANEQNLHFQQLFKILDLIGYENQCEFYHLSYGMVSLPDGRMKSREGTVVDADDILDDMERLATEEIKKRHEDWNEEQIAKISQSVALASIRFFMLKFDPARDFTFDPQSSLSFEGDTGPYLQYTHTRICSILRKATPSEIDYSLLQDPTEQELLRILAMTPLAFRTAVLQYKPSTLANHLLDIGHAFNKFYHACPVLQEDAALQSARLHLLQGVQQVLSKGLEILGIDAPEEM